MVIVSTELKRHNFKVRAGSKRAKNLRHTDRVLHHQVQADFQRHTDYIHNLGIWKKVAWYPPHVILATAAKLALWCATKVAGISRDILFSSTSPTTSPTSLNLSPQLLSFYRFHVYFTVRRILSELGGIQSISALPDDPTYNQKDNKYYIPSYKRLCAEFGVDPSTDFRLHMGKTTGSVMLT